MKSLLIKLKELQDEIKIARIINRNNSELYSILNGLAENLEFYAKNLKNYDVPIN